MGGGARGGKNTFIGIVWNTFVSISSLSRFSPMYLLFNDDDVGLYCIIAI